MQLNQLPKITARKKKRVGRGYGSGKGGHTVGRGQKGQKARNSVGILFEGTKMRKSLIKRLPFLRGKGKFKSFKKKPVVINLKYLNLLPDGTEVSLKTLTKYNLIKAGQEEKNMVKILGDGQLTKKLIIKLPISKAAAVKIEKAGGKVILEEGKPEIKNENKSSLKKAQVAKTKAKKLKSKNK